jgi:hypothetical protein
MLSRSQLAAVLDVVRTESPIGVDRITSKLIDRCEDHAQEVARMRVADRYASIRREYADASTDALASRNGHGNPIGWDRV